MIPLTKRYIDSTRNRNRERIGKMSAPRNSVGSQTSVHKSNNLYTIVFVSRPLLHGLPVGPTTWDPIALREFRGSYTSAHPSEIADMTVTLHFTLFPINGFAENLFNFVYCIQGMLRIITRSEL